MTTSTQFQKGNVPWNKGMNSGRILYTCSNCQREFIYFKSRNAKFCSIKCVSVSRLDNKFSLGRKISLEARQKMGESRTGEKNWRWIKDRSLLKTDRQKMYDTQYKYWMLSVKERDGWKCRIVNDDCKGRLEAHHILGWTEHPELRYEVNNGITLCHFHHPRKKVDEAKLSPYFQSLVAEMK